MLGNVNCKAKVAAEQVVMKKVKADQNDTGNKKRPHGPP